MELFHVELVLSVPFILLFIAALRMLFKDVLPEFLEFSRSWRDAELHVREMDLHYSSILLFMGVVVLGGGVVMMLFGVDWHALLLPVASLPITTMGIACMLLAFTGGRKGDVSREEAHAEDPDLIY